jgi:hypothetical protein
MNFWSADAAWADVENGTIKLATTIVVRISYLRTIPSFRRRSRRTSGPASAGWLCAGLASPLDDSRVELCLYRLLEHRSVSGVPEVGMEGAAGQIAHHVGGRGAPRRDAVRDRGAWSPPSRFATRPDRRASLSPLVGASDGEP